MKNNLHGNNNNNNNRQTSWKGGKIETLGNQIPDNDRDSKP